VLAYVVGALDAAGIPHMLVGSVASSFHGEPRTTQDIDLVIDPSAEQIDRLVGSIDRTRYYVDEGSARDALANHSSFNIIDTTTGGKIDLLVRRDRPFSRSEFDRRRAATLLDADVFLATAEDVILAKLEWAGDPPSERQLRDVAAIMRVQGSTLDDEYLDHWAAELGVSALLDQARVAAEL
jgi:hypothetical protein